MGTTTVTENRGITPTAKGSMLQLHFGSYHLEELNALRSEKVLAELMVLNWAEKEKPIYTN